MNLALFTKRPVKEPSKDKPTSIPNFTKMQANAKASIEAEHYENTTGAHSLITALVQLHLSTLHISAVVSPVNTNDR